MYLNFSPKELFEFLLQPMVKELISIQPGAVPINKTLCGCYKLTVRDQGMYEF